MSGSKRRVSVGMSRSEVNNVFEDVFASTVHRGISHSVTHGDASRRETAAFGPDLHDPRDEYTAGKFYRDALRAVENVLSRGRLLLGRAP